MSTVAEKQFIVDGAGKPVAVLLDIAAYERLCEAAEDAVDGRLFDAMLPGALEELKAGECISVEDYVAGRKRS
jgi:hypothetical protein